MNLRKILALVLVFAMCLSFVPTYAFAEDDGIYAVEEEEPIVEVIDEPEEEPAVEPVEEVTPDVPAEEETPAEEPAPVEDEPAEEPEEELELTLEDQEKFEDFMYFQLGSNKNNMFDTLVKTLAKVTESENYITMLADFPAEGTLKNQLINQNVTIDGKYNKYTDNDQTQIDPEYGRYTYRGPLTLNGNVTLKNMNIIGDITVNNPAAIVTIQDCTIAGRVNVSAGVLTIWTSEGYRTTHVGDLSRVTDTITISGSGKVQLENVHAETAALAITVTGNDAVLAVSENDVYGKYGVVTFTGNTSSRVKGGVKGGTFQRLDTRLLADWYQTEDYVPGQGYGKGRVNQVVNPVAVVGTGANRWYYDNLSNAVEAAKLEVDAVESTALSTKLLSIFAENQEINLATNTKLMISTDGKSATVKTSYPSAIKATLVPATADDETTPTSEYPYTRYEALPCVAYIDDNTVSSNLFYSFSAAAAEALDRGNSTVYFADNITSLDARDIAMLDPTDYLYVSKGAVDCDANVKTEYDGDVVIEWVNSRVTGYHVEPAVAKIIRGEFTAYYETLGDALLYATATDTIYLVQDANLFAEDDYDPQYPNYDESVFTKDPTIELSNHTLTLGKKVDLASNTDLTIRNGSVRANGDTPVEVITGNGAKLTLTNVTANKVKFVVYNGGELNVDETAIPEITAYSGSRVSIAQTGSDAPTSIENLTVNENAHVSVAGGTITNTNVMATATDLRISGGMFTGKFEAPEKAHIVATGGNFPIRISEDFVGTGYILKQNADGKTWDVEAGTYVAHIYPATETTLGIQYDPNDKDRFGYTSKQMNAAYAAALDHEDGDKVLVLESGEEFSYKFLDKTPLKYEDEEVLSIALKNGSTFKYVGTAETPLTNTKLVDVQKSENNGVTTYTATPYLGTLHVKEPASEAPEFEGGHDPNKLIHDAFANQENYDYIEILVLPENFNPTDYKYDGTKAFDENATPSDLLQAGDTIKVLATSNKDSNGNPILTAASFNVTDDLFIKAYVSKDGKYDVFEVATKVFQLDKAGVTTFYKNLEDLTAALKWTTGDEYITLLVGPQTITLSSNKNSRIYATGTDLTVKAANKFELIETPAENGYVQYTQIAAVASITENGETSYYSNFAKAAALADKKDLIVTVIANDATNTYTLASDSDLTVTGTKTYNVVAPAGYKKITETVAKNTFKYTAEKRPAYIIVNDEKVYDYFSTVAATAYAANSADRTVYVIGNPVNDEGELDSYTVNDEGGIFETGTWTVVYDGTVFGDEFTADAFNEIKSKLVVTPKPGIERGSTTPNVGRFHATHTDLTDKIGVEFKVTDSNVVTQDNGEYYHYFMSIGEAWAHIKAHQVKDESADAQDSNVWFKNDYAPELLHAYPEVIATNTDAGKLIVNPGKVGFDAMDAMVTTSVAGMYVTSTDDTPYKDAYEWSLLNYVAKIYKQEYTSVRNNDGSYTLSFNDPVEETTDPDDVTKKVSGYKTVAEAITAYHKFADKDTEGTIHYIDFVGTNDKDKTYKLGDNEKIIYKDSKFKPEFQEPGTGTITDSWDMNREDAHVAADKLIFKANMPALKVVGSANAVTINFAIGGDVPAEARFYLNGKWYYGKPHTGEYALNAPYTLKVKSGETVESKLIPTAASSGTAPNTQAAGYEFLGWFEGESETALNALPTTFAENATYTAKWRAISYDITYNAKGIATSTDGTNKDLEGVGVPEPSNYTVASQDITIENATLAGYAFKGWKVSIDNATPTDWTYSADKQHYVITTGSTGNYSFTPVMEQIAISIEDNEGKKTYYDALDGEDGALAAYKFDGTQKIENVTGGQLPIQIGDVEGSNARMKLIEKDFNVTVNGPYTVTTDTGLYGFTTYTLAQAVASVTAGNTVEYYTSFADAAADAVKTDGAYVTVLTGDKTTNTYALATGTSLLVVNSDNYAVTSGNDQFELKTDSTTSAGYTKYTLETYIASVTYTANGAATTEYGTFKYVAETAWDNRNTQTGVVPTITLYAAPDAEDTFTVPATTVGGYVYETVILEVNSSVDGVDYEKLVTLPVGGDTETRQGSQNVNEGRYFGKATATEAGYKYTIEDAVAYTKDKGNFYHYFDSIDAALNAISTNTQNWYSKEEYPVLLNAEAYELNPDTKKSLSIIIKDENLMKEMNAKVSSSDPAKYPTRTSKTLANEDIVYTWSLEKYVGQIWKMPYTTTPHNNGTFTITLDTTNVENVSKPELSGYTSITALKNAYDELVTAKPDGAKYFYYIKFVGKADESYPLVANQTIVYDPELLDNTFGDPDATLKTESAALKASDIGFDTLDEIAGNTKNLMVVGSKPAATVKYTFADDAPVGAKFTVGEENFEVTADARPSYERKGKVGDPVATPTAITPAGYTFDGWYVGAEKEEPATSFGTDKTYTAKWTVNEYDISYVLYDEEDVLKEVTNPNATKISYKVTDPAYTFEDPTRTGFVFDGWTVTIGDKEGTTKEKDYTLPAGTFGDVTLTAHWSNVKYNLTYDYDGGTASNWVNTHIDLEYAVNNPTKAGYKFLGWTVEETGKDAVTWDSSEATPKYVIPVGNTSEFKFTARWEANTNNITYKIEGVNSFVGDKVYKTGTFKTDEAPTTLEQPVFAGYSFQKYTLSINGEAAQDVPAGETVYEGAPAYGDRVYTIYYTANLHTLKVNGDEHAMLVATETKLRYMDALNVATTTDEHYEITGWTYEQLDIDYTPDEMKTMTMADNDMEFTPIVTPIEYTITFALPDKAELNGTKYDVVKPENFKRSKSYNITSGKVTLGTLTEDEVPGYTFVKWVDANGKDVNDFDTTDTTKEIPGNVTYYAVLTPKTYTVEFYDGTSMFHSGTAVQGETVEAYVGRSNLNSTIQALQNNASHKDIDYLDTDELWKVNGEVIKNDAKIVAETQYSLNWYKYYYITFLDENGQDAGWMPATKLTSKVTFVEVTKPTVTNDDPDMHPVWLENGEKVEDDAKINHNMIVTLSWERDTFFTVTFVNGEETHEVSVKKDAKTTSYTGFEKDGYVLDGWYLDDETFENEFDFENTAITDNITLYAKWSKFDYSGYATGSYSIALTDSFAINYYVSNLKEGTEPSDYTIEIAGGEPKTMTNMKRNGFPAIGTFAASEMTEKVHVVVKYLDNTVFEDDASVQGYCEKILKADDEGTPLANGSHPTEKLVKLVQAVLNYGSAAQVFVSKGTAQGEELANRGNFDNGPHASIEMATEFKNPAEFITGIEKATSSVAMNSVLKMYMYITFKSDVSVGDYAFYLDGTRVEPMKNGAKYGVEVKDIVAKQFGKEHVLKVVYHEGKDDAETFTYTTTPLAYLYKAYDLDTMPQAAKDCAFYLYNYYTAAIAYA